MPDSAIRPVDLIIGASLVSAEAIAQELRKRLVSRISRRRYSQWELLTIARNLLREYEPILAENLMNADLASWIAGVDQVVKKMPGQTLAGFLRGTGGPTPPIDLRTAFGEMPEPIIRFPMLERARQSLLERNIVTRAEYDALANDAKQRAFTAAYIDSEETLDSIRQALADNIQEGPSLWVFRARMEETVGESPIGPAHLETVYRTNIQAAFSDGRETMADNPIVDAVFPYQEYLPIRDGRVRREHLELATLGLSGTGVYRRDDPFWDLWTPPNGYNCFLPSTSIQGRIEAGSRAWYDGKIIEITTRSGKRVAVTANHPVLTVDGFVVASTLHKGQNVLGYSGNIDNRKVASRLKESAVCGRSMADQSGLATTGVYKQYAPASAQKLFESLAGLCHVSTVKIGPDDLHGDATFGNGYIDVVSLERKLRFDNIADGCSDFSFPFAGTLTLGSRDSSQTFGTHNSSCRSLPRCSALPLNCRAIGFDPRPFQFLGIGSAASLDIRRLQAVRDHAAIHSVLIAERQNGRASKEVSNNRIDGNIDARFAGSLMTLDAADYNSSAGEYSLEPGVADSCFYREFAERFPGNVSSDQIVDVRKHQWSGHVYDFQAQGGWLAADGIIVSNCRCGVNLLTIEAAARKGVAEAKEWLRTGRPPVVPEWRVDAIPFENEPGFGARRSRRVA